MGDYYITLVSEPTMQSISVIRELSCPFKYERQLSFVFQAFT